MKKKLIWNFLITLTAGLLAIKLVHHLTVNSRIKQTASTDFHNIQAQLQTISRMVRLGGELIDARLTKQLQSLEMILAGPSKNHNALIKKWLESNNCHEFFLLSDTLKLHFSEREVKTGDLMALPNRFSELLLTENPEPIFTYSPDKGLTYVNHYRLPFYPDIRLLIGSSLNQQLTPEADSFWESWENTNALSPAWSHAAHIHKIDFVMAEDRIITPLAGGDAATLPINKQTLLYPVKTQDADLQMMLVTPEAPFFQQINNGKLRVRVLYDFSKFNQFYWANAFNYLLIACAGGLILVFWGAFKIEERLSVEMELASDRLEAVAAGKSKAFDCSGFSYLNNHVVKAMEKLAERILERESELIQVQRTLEERVNERTSQLVENNQRLKREIRDRREAESAAEEHRKQLIKDDKLKTLGTLVAGVAHEINNPVNFITMNVPMIQEFWDAIIDQMEFHIPNAHELDITGLSFAEIKSAGPRLLSGLSDGAQRIEKIVGKLRYYAQSDSRVVKEPVHINELIKSCLPFLNSLIRKSTRNFQLKLTDHLPLVMADSSQLDQVLVNLVQNACHALEHDEQSLTITTNLSHDFQYVEVKIRDEGRGIPVEDLERIMNPFYTTKRDSGGTGLGLSICSRIIDEHDGIFEIDSRFGAYTVAIVKLPTVDINDRNFKTVVMKPTDLI